MSPDPANPFEKETGYVEDTNGDGITENASSRWKLWATDAFTVFVRGLLSGLFPGIGGGGALGVGSVALTDSTDLRTLAHNGVLGFLAGFAFGLLVKGLERFHLWQAKPENEMPNPWRAEPLRTQFVPMVPKKDAERVKEQTPSS